ncbi:hypothetical protein AALP_AAs51224U000100, partial [Arabis alpina]
MFTEESKKRNYGSIFVYCFLCFLFVVEVAFARPYYNLETLMETEAVVEERLSDVVKNSNILPFHSRWGTVPTKNHQKLSQVLETYRDRPPTSYYVKFESFPHMSNLIKD